jgi:hypothetical protein
MDSEDFLNLICRFSDNKPLYSVLVHGPSAIAAGVGMAFKIQGCAYGFLACRNTSIYFSVRRLITDVDAFVVTDSSGQPFAWACRLWVATPVGSDKPFA